MSVVCDRRGVTVLSPVESSRKASGLVLEPDGMGEVRVVIGDPPDFDPEDEKIRAQVAWALKEMIDAGMIEDSEDGYLRLTPKGWLFTRMKWRAKHVN
jgi:hypothetical protein